jgi:hypothetical protein
LDFCPEPGNPLCQLLLPVFILCLYALLQVDPLLHPLDLRPVNKHVPKRNLERQRQKGLDFPWNARTKIFHASLEQSDHP